MAPRSGDAAQLIHPVAVLGGGIAGAAAALRLAQGGARPIWIAAPRTDPFKPGEHLSAAALPLRAEEHRHAHATYSAWGSEMLIERNAIVQLEGPPTVLDRAAFEEVLSAQAIAAGATRIDRDVTDVHVAEGHWHLGTTGETIKAGFAFDATGRKARIAAQHSTRFQADKLACQYALLNKSGNDDARPVTLIEAVEHGWWYLSVLADHRVILNFYTDADLQGHNATEFETAARQTKAIGAYLADYGYASCTPPTRLTTNSTWIAPAIGAGWAAIGDAAAAFDPLSSHGMTTALWTAIEAADAFLAQDRGRMHAYADSVAKGVQDYLRARHSVYSREARWPASPFWSRRHGNAAQVA